MPAKIINHQSSIVNWLLVCLLSSVFCLLAAPGCDETSGERIEAVRAIVNQASAINSAIDASLADVNLVIESLGVAMADPNIPADWRIALDVEMHRARAKLDSLLAQKQKATSLLDTYRNLLASVDANSVDLPGELAVYGRGLTDLAPLVGGKTGGVIYLIGLLIPLAGGLIASVIKNLRKNEQITRDKSILADIVVSVKKLLESDQVKDVEEAKFILQDNQSGATQDAVDPILEKLKDPAKSL